MSAPGLGGWGLLLALLAGLASPAQAQTVVRYVHTDALGSVVALTDENRNVVERREYEPYGAQLTPAVQDGPGYTGHVQDAATGLVYMQQRYYDPGIGRFLSVDPVTADPSDGALFNRYMYAANNPYTFYDPDGRCTGSRIENGDGTCRSTGDFTTQGNGPTTPGAQTVVHQAAIQAQAGYNRETTVAKGPSSTAFPTYGMDQINMNAAFGPSGEGLGPQIFGSMEYCARAPELCRTPVDDMVENYIPNVLTIASMVYGGGVLPYARPLLQEQRIQKFACTIGFAAVCAGGLKNIKNLDDIIKHSRQQNSARRESDVIQRSQGAGQHP